MKKKHCCIKARPKLVYLVLFKGFTTISKQYFLPETGQLEKLKKTAAIIRASNKKSSVLT